MSEVGQSREGCRVVICPTTYPVGQLAPGDEGLDRLGVVVPPPVPGLAGVGDQESHDGGEAGDQHRDQNERYEGVKQRVPKQRGCKSLLSRSGG